MKLSLAAWLSIVILLLCGLPSLGQGSSGDAKHFNKDGLVFDYPSGWVLQDGSNAEAQQLNLARPDSDAQIRLFAYRNHLTTPERIAEAKRVLVDPYVNSVVRQFEQMGARPQQVPASTDISGLKFDGMKIQAMLDEPGAAEVYWAVVAQRLVVLTFFGPDKARKQATEAWDTIRNSLQVEVLKPVEKQKPVEKAKP
ncbi:MAG: hypothetical protein ACRD6N_18780 [Pyrinomonadaceae bacterium]